MKVLLAINLLSTAAAGSLRVDPLSARQRLIQKINTIEGLTWYAAEHPRFAGKPIGASKPLLGVDIEQYRENLATKIALGEIEVTGETEDAVPESFDSAENWPECAKVINDIRDQSNCGCCWAFGAAEAASDRLCIATKAKVVVPLSAQDMCFCGSSSGCDGGFPEEAWMHIKSKGLVTGGQNKGLGPFGTDAGFCSAFSLAHCHHHGPVGNDPYPSEGKPGCPSVNESPRCPRKCDAGAKAPYNKFEQDKYKFTGGVQTFNTANAVAQSIMTGGPVETAFTVYGDFENYAGGIYKKTSNKVLGGHAVRIVGWGEESGTKYWKVANSWNPYWGEKGYFRIVRGEDECGIESGAVASADNVHWKGPGVPNM